MFMVSESSILKIDAGFYYWIFVTEKLSINAYSNAMVSRKAFECVGRLSVV